jgi:RNA recognition motif-containing protein
VFPVVSAFPIAPVLVLAPGDGSLFGIIGAGRSGTDLGEGRGRSESARRGEGFNLSTKLYVGNLAFSTTEDELREVFEKHGKLVSVKVITDRETGRSRGFGFVEFEDASHAAEAQNSTNGQDLAGRELRVNEAHDKRDGGQR